MYWFVYVNRLRYFKDVIQYYYIVNVYVNFLIKFRFHFEKQRTSIAQVMR